MTDTTQEITEPASESQDAPRPLTFRNSAADWAIRAVFFLIFRYFGTAKLKGDPTGPWAVLFHQIGLGQGLRYFTGALESVCAFLVLVSATVEIGLAILIVIMFAATISSVLILHLASEAVVPLALPCGMIAFLLHRRRV